MVTGQTRRLTAFLRGGIVVNSWSGQRLPHPPRRLPVAGDFLAVSPRTPAQSMMSHADLGPLYELKLFGQRVVLVNSAELAAELCDESRFQKAIPTAVAALRAFVGDGLVTAYNDEPNWRLAHDLLVPAFTQGAMRRYHPVMVQAGDELLARWDSATGPVDVPGDMTRVTLETIGRAGFSQPFGSFESAGQHSFVAAMVAVMAEGQRAALMAAVPGARIFARAAERSYRQKTGYLWDFIDDIIVRRRAEGGEGPDDLLGLMLNAVHPETAERLDDQNIRYQTLTFLAAGHETTSSALSFALYYLASNPGLAQRAVEETDAVLGTDPDAVPSYEQVPRLRYLRRVLDESLRLWPPAPGFGREPRETTVIGGRYTMTPEDHAVVLLPRVHRDPAVWGADADEFNPDRFLPENSRGRMPHALKMFGTGERSCIGRQFALHEAVLVLARLLRRYELATEPGYRLRVAERPTLMPHGLRLRVTPRAPRPRLACSRPATGPLPGLSS
jgi:cytochrome P450